MWARGVGRRLTRPAAAVWRRSLVSESVVDLRSDTVTRPSAAMRACMAAAVVGDDVYGEDPTVRQLEERVAGLLGKADAVLMPTGTMANLACILAHTRRGDQVIVGRESHINCWEQGGASSIASCLLTTLPNNPDGTLPLADLEAAIQADDPHLPRSRLVCLENTHGGCLGTAVPVDFMAQVGALCAANNLSLHVDGARLLNAATALRLTPAALVDAADSVSVCLSKGLGCPAGSVVAGSAVLIKQVRRERKVLGGAMRQAGVLAAAGLHALEDWEATLLADHRRAAAFSDALRATPGILVRSPVVATSMVVFRLEGEGDAGRTLRLCEDLARRGVLVFPYGGRGDEIRAVLHRDVGDAGLQMAIAAIAAALSEGKYRG
ncbi:PLP-dependent threonine aldolase [Baffinella frigidus]|nr:PLP-dependent threonine aldolase [Cryptophyta sp. CCMP2293]